MTNVFINTSLCARDSSVILQDSLVASRLTNRNKEDLFGSKKGATIKIKCPPTFTTTRDLLVDINTVADSITDVSVNLELDRQFYKRIDLTTLDSTVNLEDFNEWILEPCVRGLADDLDAYTIDRAVQGFAQNTAGIVGTAGNRPSTVAHLANGEKSLNDNGVPNDYRVGVIDTTVHNSLVQLIQFQSRDYGENRASTLETSMLPKFMSISYFMDQNCGTQNRGSVAQGTNVYGGSQAGKVLNIDNGSATSTGTINQGARFTIAGVSGTYVCTDDVTASSGYFAVPLNIALASAPADNAAVSYSAALSQNYIYDYRALGAAIVAPTALSVSSAIDSFNGIGIRVTRDISTTTMSDTIVFDVLAAVKVINANAGFVLQA